MSALETFRHVVVLFVGIVISGCAMHQPDYTLYQRHMPRSVLVFPPLNETAEITAPDRFFPTITEPVAERGYYVIPVAVAEAMLRENGAVGPVEMRQVSYKKLRDIFGADALLDITIQEWGTQYIIISSSTRVRLSYRLIDLATGSVLWTGEGEGVDSENTADGNLTAVIAGALAHAISSASFDVEIPLARRVNNQVLLSDWDGLLPGPRLPEDGRK